MKTYRNRSARSQGRVRQWHCRNRICSPCRGELANVQREYPQNDTISY